MAATSEEAILLKHIWKKAYKEDVVIRLSSAKEAQRIRFALYNAVSAVKKGQVIDEELLEAAINVSITYEDKMTLKLSRTLTGTLAALAESVGFNLETAVKEGEGQTMTQEEQDALASLQRLMAKMEQAPAEKTTTTPYYQRDKTGE